MWTSADRNSKKLDLSEQLRLAISFSFLFSQQDNQKSEARVKPQFRRV